MPIIFVMQGKCLLKDISRPVSKIKITILFPKVYGSYRHMLLLLQFLVKKFKWHLIVQADLDNDLCCCSGDDRLIQSFWLKNPKQVQCSPFIMLCLESIQMDCVISESCYKWTILLRNYRKMTMLAELYCFWLVRLSVCGHSNSVIFNQISSNIIYGLLPSTSHSSSNTDFVWHPITKMAATYQYPLWWVIFNRISS